MAETKTKKGEARPEPREDHAQPEPAEAQHAAGDKGPDRDWQQAEKPADADAALLKSLPKDKLRRIAYDMLLARRFEEKTAEAYALGKIGGFCHLYIGQEAVAV
ncbi:MAG TPA: hypothetical protein VFQ76_17065, partial [Longimicrobiaceae bacterium]|nr:hypothetical protein [Longimicrobiaceae bacterium]